jgi:DNA-binding CsgD family transcriptional regulator/tetratricopeptide (TPR) repeat protein
MVRRVQAEGLVGRDEELRRIDATLRRCLGAVLVGAAGVGKSALADAIARTARARNALVVRVRATVGSSELPLAAFSGWLQTSEQFLTPMMTEIMAAIRTAADGGDVLLVIDDIDLLDDASSVLVHQLLLSGSTTVLATMRRGRLLPGDVADLRARGDIDVIEIEPLGEAGTRALADAVAGTPLSDAAHHRLHDLTRGNPLYTRVLIANAHQAGMELDGIVELPTDAPMLADIVTSRVAGLGEAHRAALLHIAFAEPCGPGELASTADAEVLADLDAAELITCETDGKRLVLRLGHPLFGEVLRSSTSRLRRRAVLANLARDLQATGVRRRSDGLKLARLALDGGVPVPSELIGSAVSTAYAAGDMVFAERLARPEYERTGSIRLGWDLANAEYTLGDIDGARRTAAQLAERATAPSDRMAAAMISANTEYWLASDLDTAIAIVDAALERDPDDGTGEVPVTRAELLGARALLFSGSGFTHAAEQAAAPLVDLPLGPAYVRGALAYSGAAYSLGRGIDAVAALDRAVEAFGVMGEAGIALSRRTVLTNRAMGHWVNGDLDRAADDAARVVENAISEQQLSLGYMLKATIEATRGRPTGALPIVRTAGQWWQRGSAGGLAQRWVHSITAYVAGSAGDVVLARTAIEQFDADTHPSRLIDFLGELGRARLLVAEADPEAARRGLEVAISRQGERDQRAGMMMCAYELVRLDRAERALELLTEMMDRTQGPLWPAMCDHARGVATRDVELVMTASDALDRLGWVPYAADAAAHAAEIARRAGDQRAAAQLVQRTADLRARCDERMPTTTLAVDLGPVSLTRREREIGLLASQGLASREIGDRLFISTRTVDNHLGKVYDKLGVRSRSELALALSS